jgi:toxin ParE1/3/4
MKVEWTSLAQADLKHIHGYIHEDNPSAAIAVLGMIRNAVHGQLKTSPLSGRVGRVEGTRELVIPRLPYIVAYRIGNSGIQIIRVLHGAQRWPQAL